MKITPFRLTARATLAALFVLSGLFFVALAFSKLFAGSTVTPSYVPMPDTSGPTPFSGTYDPHQFPCASARHHFMVPEGEVRAIVHTSATLATNDITVNLLYGPGDDPSFLSSTDSGTSSEVLTYEPPGGLPAGEYQVQICQTPSTNGVPQMAPFTYNGEFATDNTTTGIPTPPPQFGPIPPAPLDAGPKIGFETFQPPPTLVTMTTSSQGPVANTVEYLANDAGEPSVGVNWNSTQDTVNGITAFQSDLQTVFIKFDESCPANGLTSSWYRSQAPTSQVANQDPIGFVDRVTGRVFCGQLTLLSPTCKISYTDTDGKDALGNPGPDGWVPSSGPLGSGVDHQTIGGGPYHEPLPPENLVGYKHAVYYMSQDLGPGLAFRSDNGGQTFPVGPIDMWATQCAGLHGHAKVTPNTAATRANHKVGTVFVPNNSCSNDGAVVVSEDNGMTWNIRPMIQTRSNPNFQDPAVSIDDNGRVYFAMSNYIPPTAVNNGGGSQLIVGISDNNGVDWSQIYDVGAVYGLKNVMYPAAVAGDAGRAAVAFYGSTVGGDPTTPDFTGVWHLYVAHTFDGGGHWTTTDATPNDPVQRGPIWAHGQADIARNMLDFFDMTVDKQGRVQVGYADGCVDGHCVQAANTADGNAYTDRTSITRQSSGRRMFAANDPANPQTAVEAPGIPLVSAKRVGGVVTLSWSEGDTGNSAIQGYQVLRGESSGTEALLPNGNLPANQTTFVDNTATDPLKTYHYKVLATNAAGTSCGNNEVAVAYAGDYCTGLILQRTPMGHPEQPGGANTAPANLSIDYISVGERPGSDYLIMKMKVTNMGAAPPPSSRWRIVWNSYAALPYDPDPTDQNKTEQFYAGMSTDANSVVKFEWGVVTTAVLGLVVGFPTETEEGLLPGSSFNPDGTITLFVPKSVIGNPQPGDLLGAVNGRTFTGDTTETQDIERSTALIDHTFVKAQRDNGRPAATYTVLGNQNVTCPAVVPVSAVSRKIHPLNIQADIPLPFVGTPGIECRQYDATPLNHQIVVNFPLPVTFTTATVSRGTGTVASTSNAGNQVTINLTGVADQQRIDVTLFNVTDGTNTSEVTIPMIMLAGDSNADLRVNVGDVNETKANDSALANVSPRTDLNVDGRTNVGDTIFAKQHSGHSVALDSAPAKSAERAK